MPRLRSANAKGSNLAANQSAKLSDACEQHRLFTINKLHKGSCIVTFRIPCIIAITCCSKRLKYNLVSLLRTCRIEGQKWQ